VVRVVRLFVITARDAAYSGPQRCDLMLAQCASPGRGGELVGVCDVCATCKVKDGLSGSKQVVGHFYSAPPLGVAYRLAKTGLAIVQRQLLQLQQ